ncbi:MAG TPA: hypothetical protein EYP41_14845 [Anaerolineae bacterium]|nr:hypothetical protein [Anaerolineae bacterium]HIP69820.1 hypothetical protein [Anaerolineae bacterium]
MDVKEIEAAIKQLPVNELVELSTWLENYRMQVWDKQIENDLATGRFDRVLAEVDVEYEMGATQTI